MVEPSRPTVLGSHPCASPCGKRLSDAFGHRPGRSTAASVRPRTRWWVVRPLLQSGGEGLLEGLEAPSGKRSTRLEGPLSPTRSLGEKNSWGRSEEAEKTVLSWLSRNWNCSKLANQSSDTPGPSLALLCRPARSFSQLSGTGCYSSYEHCKRSVPLTAD